MTNSSPLSLRLPLCLMFLCSGIGVQAVAESPTVSKDKKGRLIVREDRPENSRGWVVVAKSNFWPLCFEALDNLEESRSLIGKTDKKSKAAFADSLDKSGAWLRLAASAAMTDGKAGIVYTGDLLGDVAEKARDGSSKHTDGDYNELITLAEICVAKSHLIRAAGADKDYTSQYVDNKKEGDKKSVSKEIQVARLEAQKAQLTYDVQQSVRHLEVAQVYLKEAAKEGRLELPESVTAEIPQLPTETTAADLAGFDEDVIQTRVDAFTQFVEEKRSALSKKFADDDE